MIIVQILCEFVENSFEHGYRSATAEPIDVRATLDAQGMVQASVTDRGRWKAPSSDPGMRGRGLMLACELDVPAGEVVSRALMRERLVVNATGPTTVRLLPPLTLTRDEVDEGARRLRAALGEACD